MRLRAPVSDARHQDILELEPLLRRVVGARVRDLDTVDDLVQEAADPGVRLAVPGRSLLPVPSREVLARHAGQPAGA